MPPGTARNVLSAAADATSLEQLETELAILARRLEQASRRATTHRRLDRAGYLLARTIESLGPTGVNDLADALGLDGSTVTRQAATLIERDFVTRRADPADGRAVLLSLTAAGRRELAQVRDARLDRLGASLESWDDDDVGTLADLLGRFNVALASTDDATPGPSPRTERPAPSARTR